MKHYIIDGNNLIGKVKKLSGLQSKDKQSAREQLVYLLQNYFSRKKVKVSLNFDGYENSPLNISNGKIIYSESKTADEKIKDQISSSKTRRDIVVVSSDNGIRDYAKVCGCSLMTSEEFNKEFSIKNEIDDEARRIKEINNIEEFKKLFNAKD
ncbi:MAG: NYN domain-containing protein [Ignavibacteria bacterium]|nr:NYN domain-containing protein [Ignavibacteria bacterium]